MEEVLWQGVPKGVTDGEAEPLAVAGKPLALTTPLCDARAVPEGRAPLAVT